MTDAVVFPKSNSRPGLKTWSTLAGTRKRPSEYEILTYNLHARTRDPQAPYEQDPDTMMNSWYKKHVVASPLTHPDWDAFRDPDQLTYRAYTTMQDGQEQYVDGLLEDHSENGHDASLPSAWVDALARLYTPGRYTAAAGQMASAYLVQVAPASTITNAAAFQEADCFRWISRIAYRTRELANSHADRGFVTGERARFETDPAWQGIRELLEKALVAYDWGEAFVAYNVVAARAVEEACVRQLGLAARRHGDTLTAMLADNQMKDAARSRRWTAALVGQCLAVESNRAVIAGWLGKWLPLADRAIDMFCAALPESPAAGEAAKAACAGFRRELGLA
ncbi:aromatic/alkene monooxygenase hydroxylase subunit beta [Zavarzinia aquatilis]|uniref:Toluene monooxygenase n=1 Tax=Zavarzinia aquatilis TaxID=2211142 RepID=A0A317DYF0_9PROT|nr:aromatic/alkene monooxygenase hydroxylase subunit beta [Zavarzinia aquatilis]PWR19502.1 toluene monooxygenase [Zavarzinia aquatilis]